MKIVTALLAYLMASASAFHGEYSVFGQIVVIMTPCVPLFDVEGIPPWIVAPAFGTPDARSFEVPPRLWRILS